MMVMVKDPEPRERILRMIHEVCGGLEINSIAEEYIEDLVILGVDKVKFDSTEEARNLEAEENFRVFAEQLRVSTLERANFIGIEDVNRVLASICPIYPIC